MSVPTPSIKISALWRAALALAATALLYASLPDAPAWRRWLTRLPGEWTWTAAGGLAALALAAWARQARKTGWADAAARLGWAVLLAAGTAVLLPEIGLEVERIHLFEYGGLGLLYAWAVHPWIGGRAGLVLAGILAFAAGVIDEWIQFHLSTRVGDVSDVWLNGASAALMLLAVDRVLWRPAPRPLLLDTRRLIGAALAAALFLTAGFVERVTVVGYRHSAGPGLVFFSRFPLSKLAILNATQAEVYAAQVRQLYPEAMHAYLKRQSAYDPYLAEVLVRLFRRNVHLKRGDLPVARAENEILTRYFPAVVTLSGQNWSAAQPAAPHAQRAEPYISPVGEGDIRVLLTSGGLWGSAAFLAALSLFWGWRPETHSGSGAESPLHSTLAERS